MTAPKIRIVNQYTGEITRPSKFWDALEQANQAIDENAELRIRLQEVTAERDWYIGAVAERDQLAAYTEDIITELCDRVIGALDEARTTGGAGGAATPTPPPTPPATQ